MNSNTSFCTGLIVPAIVEPLRYFFSNPDSGTGLVWDPDPMKRTVDVRGTFSIDEVPAELPPRVVVSRGAFSCGSEFGGVNHSLYRDTGTFKERKGDKDAEYYRVYRGASVVMIEARSKGVCELLTDMTLHFLAWSSPIICDSLGFKEFATNLSISDCNARQAAQEGSTGYRYETTIQVPWLKEELFRVRTSNPTLKEVLLNLIPEPAI